MKTTNYKRPLLDVVAFSPEGGFAQSGVMTIQKWVYDDSQAFQKIQQVMKARVINLNFKSL